MRSKVIVEKIFSRFYSSIHKMNELDLDLLESVRNEDPSQVEKFLSEGANPNLYVYGFLIENVRNQKIASLLIEYGANTDLDHFTSCRNVIMIKEIAGKTDNKFWHSACDKFFPKDIYRRDETIYIDTELYKSNFYTNCIKVNQIELEILDVDDLKKIYFPEESNPGPFEDSLILWDIVKNTPFSIRTLRKAIKKKKLYFQNLYRTINRYTIENSNIKEELIKILDVDLIYNSFEDLKIINEYFIQLEYLLQTIAEVY